MQKVESSLSKHLLSVYVVVVYVMLPHRFTHVTGSCPTLKVPKREIFDRSDFHDFYTIKSLRKGDFVVKIIFNNI